MNTNTSLPARKRHGTASSAKRMFGLSLLLLICFLPRVYSADVPGSGDKEFSGVMKDGVREIEMAAFKYGYTPDPIMVKYNEKIRLVITAMDVPHGIRITEYKIKQILPLNKTKVIEFTASRKGTFMIHCTVYCGGDHGKQKSRLLVL